MSKRIDWNLKMVRSREARELLPKQTQASTRTDWGKIRVGHLDTGYTPGTRCSAIGIRAVNGWT